MDSNFLELTLHGSKLPINAASFSPDGRFIVTAYQDKTLRVWRADRTGDPLRLGEHTGAIQSARFSLDGKFIVTAPDDGTARVWRADGPGPSFELGRHEERVRTAA